MMFRKNILMSGFVAAVSLFVGIAYCEETNLLTNGDVVAMVKAGLAPSTIIMAIERGPRGFDTSPNSLIALKSQGVPDAVLEALMHPSVKPTAQTTPVVLERAPVKSSSTGNALLDAYGKTIGVKTGEANLSGDVLLIDGANTSKMRYTSMRLETVMGPGFFSGGAKSINKIDGKASVCRLSHGKPRFIFNLERNVQLRSRVALVSLSSRSDYRSIQSMEMGAGKISYEFPKDRIVPMTVTESSMEGGQGNGLAQYEVAPENPLKPGEYALVFDQTTAYDFGVDGN